MESLGAPMRKILVLMRAILISGIPYDSALKGEKSLVRVAFSAVVVEKW